METEVHRVSTRGAGEAMYWEDEEDQVSESEMMAARAFKK